MNSKQFLDYLTSFIMIAIPVLVGYQAQIMGALPQDNAFLIYAVSIIFGILSAYAAKIRKDEEVQVALVTPAPGQMDQGPMAENEQME